MIMKGQARLLMGAAQSLADVFRAADIEPPVFLLTDDGGTKLFRALLSSDPWLDLPDPNDEHPQIELAGLTFRWPNNTVAVQRWARDIDLAMTEFAQ